MHDSSNISLPLILASGSPRRKEILEFFSYPFTQISSGFDESTVPFLGDPKAYVSTLALEKAYAVKPDYPQAIILTADTVVFIDGMVLGKPNNEQEMVEMLSRLSGRKHTILTGVAVISPTVTLCEVEETQATCNVLSLDDIHRYMRAHSLHDKAGAYTLQKSGSLIVKEIHGCYHNVIGLPINTLRKLLKEVGIDLWDYLKRF